RQQANGGEMGALNRGFYTKDIFCKHKMDNRQISVASVSNQQRGPHVVYYPGWGRRTQRSSVVRLQRCGHSEVAVISDTVWAQCPGLQYAGSARTIPNKLAQEMQYAAHIGMPSGRSSSFPGLGTQILRTGFAGACRSSAEISFSLCGGVRLFMPSTPAVFFPLFSWVTLRTARLFALQDAMRSILRLGAFCVSPRAVA